MTGIVFSLETAGRVLTSGLYCATTPARTARSGNSVPHGNSNFRLSLSAMVASARSHVQKIGSRHATCLRLIGRFVLQAGGQRHKCICKKPASDSREREKIASGWQQRLHRALIDTSFVSSMAREILKPKKGGFPIVEGAQRLPTPSRLESFDKFHFDWNVDADFVIRLRQKFADSGSSHFTIVASKFIHIHTDEFAGELTAHAARVGKRMSHRLVSMCQTVIDAFANNFAEIAAHCWRNIFAHNIATKRQRQAGFALPPLAKIDNLLKTGLRISELPLVND